MIFELLSIMDFTTDSLCSRNCNGVLVKETNKQIPKIPKLFTAKCPITRELYIPSMQNNQKLKLMSPNNKKHDTTASFRFERVKGGPGFCKFSRWKRAISLLSRSMEGKKKSTGYSLETKHCPWHFITSWFVYKKKEKIVLPQITATDRIIRRLQPTRDSHVKISERRYNVLH